MVAPCWDVGRHQSFEKATVIWHLQVKEFMHDHEVLEIRILFVEVDG
jgi:hypothetical protein